MWDTLPNGPMEVPEITGWFRVNGGSAFIPPKQIHFTIRAFHIVLAVIYFWKGIEDFLSINIANDIGFTFYDSKGRVVRKARMGVSVRVFNSTGLGSYFPRIPHGDQSGRNNLSEDLFAQFEYPGCFSRVLSNLVSNTGCP